MPEAVDLEELEKRKKKEKAEEEGKEAPEEVSEEAKEMEEEAEEVEEEIVEEKPPKKPKPKRERVRTKRYEFYESEGDTVDRLKKSCPRCGPGVFMADHGNRLACGKCGYTEFKQEA